MNYGNKIRLGLLFFLFLLISLLFSSKINLATADLGRHIKNGEMILQGETLQAVLKTNFYSYTYPDFPFLNHHWGSGVIFYLVYKIAGFVGLSVFFTILSLATFSLFFDVALKKRKSPEITFLVALLLLPLLANRTEIRPEMFTYLFCAVFLWVLNKVGEMKETKEKWQWLVTLPILEILWVNLHIYFFLGFILIGIFLVERMIKGELKESKGLGMVLLLSVLASLLNPAGVKGLLYPLKIFEGYGYRLFENQTIWFLDKIVKYPPNLYFKIAFGLLLLSWFFVIFQRKNFSIINLILTLFISYLGWTAVRNFAIFGYFALPIIVGNIRDVGDVGGEEKEARRTFFCASLGILILFGIFMLEPSFWLERISVGFGLKKGNAASAEFFLKEGLKGPIFNNYDNGSYLIYFLYPQEKVFVDNRPEAYPEKFFKEVYISMQEREDIWREIDKKYNFNTIFFHRNDLTPWAQTFLINRVSDPNWAPVFVDDYSIIFLKRIKDNEVLIKKFELTKEMFSIKK